MSTAKKAILFTSHTANFQKFNLPLMRMLRGELTGAYENLNLGDWIVHYASANEEKIQVADKSFKIDFARNPLRLDKHIKSYRQLKKLLDKNHYDIVHTHTPVGSVITRLAARKARKNGTKVIYTSHGFHFYNGASSISWAIWYPIEKIMAHFTDILVTINKEDYQRAKKFKTKAQLIHGVGVDTEIYNDKTTKQHNLSTRKNLSISESDFIITYIAEFNTNKNHKIILKSLRDAIPQNSNIKVLFLGKGKLKEKTKKLARRLGIANNVLFLGYQDNVVDILRTSDLYVSASIREGLGMGVLEAIACGIPIIISNNRGHREIVHEDRKYLFSAVNEDALRRKILAAHNGKDYHISFSQEYSLLNSLSGMQKIYQDAIS